MWPFVKKKEEMIDLTLLTNRGSTKTSENKVLDLNSSMQVTQNESSQPNDPSDNSSALGFLANAAESSQATPSPQVGGNKLDDLEYKVDGVSKRLNSILDRIDLLEKKMDRLERKGE